MYIYRGVLHAGGTDDFLSMHQTLFDIETLLTWVNLRTIVIHSDIKFELKELRKLPLVNLFIRCSRLNITDLELLKLDSLSLQCGEITVDRQITLGVTKLAISSSNSDILAELNMPNLICFVTNTPINITTIEKYSKLEVLKFAFMPDGDYTGINKLYIKILLLDEITERIHDFSLSNLQAITQDVDGVIIAKLRLLKRA